MKFTYISRPECHHPAVTIEIINGYLTRIYCKSCGRSPDYSDTRRNPDAHTGSCH